MNYRTCARVTIFQYRDLFSQPTLRASLIARVIGVEMGSVMGALRQVMFQKNNCNRQSAFV